MDRISVYCHTKTSETHTLRIGGLASLYNPFELCAVENKRFSAAIVKLNCVCIRVSVECDHESIQGRSILSLSLIVTERRLPTALAAFDLPVGSSMVNSSLVAVVVKEEDTWDERFLKLVM
jgi:hypothetical protein